MPVCFCIDNSTLSRNISNGSRNNPADVHRTSRTSLQFHHNNRHNVPLQHRSIQIKSTPHPTPQPKNSKPLRHNVPHPIPKHTDKSQHRTPHHNPRTQNSLGTTFHIQYRSIQTKVNTVSHTTTQELLKKSPRGVQRGRGFTAPLRFFHSFPKQKNQALCQESKNKTKTQSHNKQRKRIRKK